MWRVGGLDESFWCSLSVEDRGFVGVGLRFKGFGSVRVLQETKSYICELRAGGLVDSQCLVCPFSLFYLRG